MPPPIDDAHDLAAFGYRQELGRSLGAFSSFAAGFSYLSILTGMFQLFPVGYAAGGPAFFWTWPVVLIGQMSVALCFAELAAAYPLSGGVYQWAKLVGSPRLGWAAGWVYLACAVVTLAAVALALQTTLPLIWTGFQVVPDSGGSGAAHARNAVLLGGVLVVFSTVINTVGLKWMARLNNVGVAAELAGAVLLIALLVPRARRSPAILFETLGHGAGRPGGYLAAFLAAGLTASYVMYGFDTAGALAEETTNPRRRAPRAILQALAAAGVAGALLLILGLLAAPDLPGPDPGRPGLSLAGIVRDVLGGSVGTLFLADIALAVVACTLAVQAGAVRLAFAMARDGNLPYAQSLARVSPATQTPVLPALLSGVGAAAILAANLDFPRVVEVVTSVAIVWANLAYLLTTSALLLRRLRGEWPGAADLSGFSLGRWGCRSTSRRSRGGRS